MQAAPPPRFIRPKGQLLVSTKSHASGRKIILLVCALLSFIMGIIFSVNFKIFRPMGYELFDNAQIGTVIGVFLIIFLFAYPVYAVIVTFFGSSSYCVVYENMVVGKSALSRRTPNTPM